MSVTIDNTLARECHIAYDIPITIEKKENFRNWIEKKSSYNEFLKLRHKDKEKLFLKWKWGMNDDETNVAMERTRKYLITRLTPDEVTIPPTDAKSYFWGMIVKWEKYCDDVKAEIFGRQESPELKKIRNIFESEEE